MQQIPVMFFTRDYDFGHTDTFATVTSGQELQASSVRVYISAVDRITAAVQTTRLARRRPLPSSLLLTPGAAPSLFYSLSRSRSCFRRS